MASKNPSLGYFFAFVIIESGKVKFLRLGRWKGILEEEDLPLECRYIRFSEYLDMLGVPLFASYQKTRKKWGKTE